MATDTKDRNINTTTKAPADGAKHLPHERDESPDAQHPATRGVMQQAASDLERGLVDTDMHGERGVEKVQPAAPKSATPLGDGDGDHKNEGRGNGRGTDGRGKY